MVRLYVGGLPPDVTTEAVRQRFAPFGAVLACELAPARSYHCDGEVAVFHRGFAHVELEPADGAALQRCLSAYNGSKWRGHVMRCQPARQSALQRLAEERAAAAAAAAAQVDGVGGGWGRGGLGLPGCAPACPTCPSRSVAVLPTVAPSVQAKPVVVVSSPTEQPS